MRRRRVGQLVASAVLMAAFLLPTAGASSSAAAPLSGPEAGMTAGLPYADPRDAAFDGPSEVQVTLDAAQTRFEVGGRTVWGESYNGSFVAPTLHLYRGRSTRIVLVNHLPVVTNLHFHGLKVSPLGHSDNVFISVQPGQTFRYVLAIPMDHPQGTYWYHSHAMPKGMGHMFTPGLVENQIFAGLSGALIIGDDRSLLPPPLRHIEAHTMVLKDVQVDDGGHILQNTATTQIDPGAPTARLVNGELRPVLQMRAGETQLWRFANAGADIFYHLAIDGHRFTVIGEDGVPVAVVTHPRTLLLPPGKRYDVLLTADDQPAAFWLRTLAFRNGPVGDAWPDVPLLSVVVRGHSRPAPPPELTSMPGAAANLAGAAIAQRRTVSLAEYPAGNQFFINGMQFDMSHSVFSTPAHIHTVEEWTVVNLTGENHPFHLHNVDFQVMSIDGVPQPFTAVQDIVLVPHLINGAPGQVVIRIPFASLVGPYMFHCHIAKHEDNGMMSYINVVDAGAPTGLGPMTA